MVLFFQFYSDCLWLCCGYDATKITLKIVSLCYTTFLCKLWKHLDENWSHSFPFHPYLHFTHVSILFKFALTEIFFVDAMLLYFWAQPFALFAQVALFLFKPLNRCFVFVFLFNQITIIVIWNELPDFLFYIRDYVLFGAFYSNLIMQMIKIFSPKRIEIHPEFEFLDFLDP